MIGAIIHYPVTATDLTSKYAVVIGFSRDEGSAIIAPFTRWGWPSIAHKTWRRGRWEFLKDYYGVREDYPQILLCPICEGEEWPKIDILSKPLRRRKDSPYWKGPDHYQCKKCRRHFLIDGALKEVTK